MQPCDIPKRLSIHTLITLGGGRGVVRSSGSNRVDLATERYVLSWLLVYRESASVLPATPCDDLAYIYRSLCCIFRTENITLDKYSPQRTLRRAQCCFIQLSITLQYREFCQEIRL